MTVGDPYISHILYLLCQDRHAVGNELPLVDESQDYELLFASEDEEGLTLRFKRPMDTCDEDDFYITVR